MRVVEVLSETSVVAQHASCLEPGDRVFDACTAPSMTTPRGVTHDTVTAKHRRDLWDASIASVGRDASVMPTNLLDERATVVDWIVAIPWSTRGRRDDSKVSSPDQSARWMSIGSS
jgi:hypothetical protein